MSTYRRGAIKWLGYVDEYQKAFLYRYAEMAIYPSFFEGFGIPVVEAMYFGCPVACSYSSGIPEAGGDAAFYFDPTSTAELRADPVGGAAAVAARTRGHSRRQPPSGLAFHLARLCPPDRRSDSRRRCRKRRRHTDLECSRDHRLSPAERRTGVRADRRIAPAAAGRDRTDHRDRDAACSPVWRRDGRRVSLLRDPRALARS